jgi:hypothetical protein
LPSPGVVVGVVEDLGPALSSCGRDGGPLAEGSSRGCEGRGVAGVDERGCRFLVEFDHQLLGEVVPGGEEVAVEAEAGVAHHG